MNQERQNFLAMFGIAPNALTRPGRPFDNWIDRFKVTRVRGQTNLNFRTRG